MNVEIVRTYMSDILHAITQGLLIPDIVLLIAFIAYALFCIGSVIAEFFSERRHFKVAMPKFLAALMAAEEDEIPAVIEQSGLLKRQKAALLTVYDYRILPGDALVALIKRLVGEEESRYDSIAGRNNMAARVSPMLGLMGTLIPLGPGIQALGKANTAELSASLLIAFDTTVAGLVVAAVCMIIGKIRGNWYANYMSALDSGMATMLQKIEDMRSEGKIAIEEPSDYAFLFEKTGDEQSKKKGKRKKGADGEDPIPEKGAPDRGQPDKSGFVREPAAPGVMAAASEPARASASSADLAFSSDALPSTVPLPAKEAFPTGSLPTIAPFPQQADQPGVPAPAGSPVKTDWTQAGRPQGAGSGTVGFPQTFDVGSPSFPQQPASALPPFSTGMLEPISPIVANAPFDPVPDPAFISNLASAQATFDAAAAPRPQQGDAPRAGWGQPAFGNDAGSPTAAPSRQAWGANPQRDYRQQSNYSAK